MESWSLSQFIEPAVRYDSRLTVFDFVWHPHTRTSHFRWSLPQYKLWVKTTK